MSEPSRGKRPPSPPGAPFPSISVRTAFQEILRILILLHDQALAIERDWRRLTDIFRKEFPKTRLRLCPWTLRKKGRPVAFYWITLRHSHEVRPPLDLPGSFYRQARARRPTWKHYIPKLTMNLIKYSGGNYYARRGRIRFFDRERRLLGEAHSAVVQARAAIMRILDYGYARKTWPVPFPAIPDDLVTRSLRELPPAAVIGAWRLSHLTVWAGEDLRGLVREYKLAPVSRFVRPTFVRDREHPHGRVRWAVPHVGLLLSSLTDKTKRRIGIPKKDRAALTRFEKERRRLAREYRRHLSALGRIRRRGGNAMDVAHRRLSQLGILPRKRREGRGKEGGRRSG